jgi:hypothetical protein
LEKIKRRKTNWVGYIWHRNCLVKRIIQEKIEGRKELREDEEEEVSSY